MSRGAWILLVPIILSGDAAAADRAAQLVVSPWTKFCFKEPGANPKDICFTGSDLRAPCALPALAAVVLGREGDRNTSLRVTLPPGVQRTAGTRLIIDRTG